MKSVHKEIKETVYLTKKVLFPNIKERTLRLSTEINSWMSVITHTVYLELLLSVVERSLDEGYTSGVLEILSPPINRHFVSDEDDQSCQSP